MLSEVEVLYLFLFRCLSVAEVNGKEKGCRSHRG